MTPTEAVTLALARERRREEDKHDFRQNLQRLAAERDGMTCDAYIARFDDPDREPMLQ